MKRILIISGCLLAVLATAGHPNPEKLADAIYRAEGGAKARVPYGVLSVRVKDAADARRITINSINNNWKRWEKANNNCTFIETMAKRWCPPSADPVGHKNWIKNVNYYYYGRGAIRKVESR
jgi:hypothetical protein